MSALFRKFWDVCLLSAGPQDIPHSPMLLKSLLFVYFLIEVMAWTITENFEYALMASVLDIFILFAYVFLLLKFFNQLSRFVQSLSCFLAVSIIFQCFEIPLMVLLEQVHEGDRSSPEVGLILIALYSWSLAVFAHIFRQILSVRQLSAFVLTLSYVLINISAIQLALPEIGQ